MQSAWESAFGANQNSSHAYYDAVRAVETLSCPLISPNDQQATMLKLLWHSQSDRHGRADYESVSIDEAQAAVLLAATLVGWLARGMLTRVST